MLRLGHGDVAGSREDLLAMHRLSRHLDRSEFVIEYLVGIAIDWTACRADEAWLCDGRVTGEVAKAYLAQLQEVGPPPTPHNAIGVGERCLYLSSVMNFPRRYAANRAAGNAQDPASDAAAGTGCDIMLRTGNQYYDRLVAATDKPFVEQKTLFKKLVQDVCTPQIDGATIQDRMAKMVAFQMLSTLTPALDAVCGNREKSATKFDLVEIALAARAFDSEKGKWPEKLADLVPGYLKALPTDRFTDKQPLQMRLENDGLIIWSVGPEGKGMTGDENKDLAVKLHVK
jgi:hypothetical protein